MRAALLARHSPVEECQIVAGRADGIGIEEVIRSDVVLVDAALHQPHPHHLRVEAVVAGDVRRHRREMMDTGQVHKLYALAMISWPRAYDPSARSSHASG